MFFLSQSLEQKLTSGPVINLSICSVQQINNTFLIISATTHGKGTRNYKVIGKKKKESNLASLVYMTTELTSVPAAGCST